MKRFAVLTLALSLFAGVAATSLAQGTDSSKGTGTTKKTTKKKKGKKKSTQSKAT